MPTWVSVTSHSTGDQINAMNGTSDSTANHTFTDSSTGITNMYTVDWGIDWGRQQYVNEMQARGLPTYQEYYDELDPVEQKIHDERAWMQRMATRAEKRQKEQAEETALALVRELFGEVEGNWIIVPSTLHEGRVYHVPVNGKGGSLVKVMEGGEVVSKLCAHPTAKLPAGDHAIAKALWLEANEREYLEIANVHPV